MFFVRSRNLRLGRKADLRLTGERRLIFAAGACRLGVCVVAGLLECRQPAPIRASAANSHNDNFTLAI